MLIHKRNFAILNYKTIQILNKYSICVNNNSAYFLTNQKRFIVPSYLSISILLS